MSSNPLRLKYLLQKYLDNSCTKQESEEFWKLMSELSENDLIDLDLQDGWQDKNKFNLPQNGNWDDVYAHLKQKMTAQETDYSRVISLGRKRSLRLAVAAAVLVLIAFSWLLLKDYAAKHQRTSPVAFISHGHQVLHLPDGTVVTLNNNSKLNYPNAFTGATREVYLTGEAYFDVKHDSAKPFLVHTGSFVTKVLGTAFNIKAYPHEANISVTVTSGKVQVQRDDNKRSFGVLLPGQQLVVNKAADTAIASLNVNVQEVVKWKTGDMDLVFDNISFGEAAVVIGNHFSVELRFKNEAIRRCKFTGDFTQDSLVQVMDIITQLTNTTWRKEGEKIIWLDGKGCE